MSLEHKALTEIIISAFYAVYNGLGYEFLEKVYENALLYELKKRGLNVEQQVRIHVYYAGQIVGDYFADLVVENTIILELKAAEAISKADTAQLINYLKSTRCEVGFVFNFGPEAKFERRYYRNANKKNLKTNP